VWLRHPEHGFSREDKKAKEDKISKEKFYGLSKTVAFYQPEMPQQS
jgi:hypothetical protein